MENTHFFFSWLVCQVYGQDHWLFLRRHVEIREIWLEDIGWTIHVQYFKPLKLKPLDKYVKYIFDLKKLHLLVAQAKILEKEIFKNC